MNLSELILGGGGITMIVLTLLQVSKIEINPWSCVARGIGRAINAEMYVKMDDLTAEVKELRNIGDERNATLMRTHILHFNDEILHQQEHTKEHFDQILDDIDEYDSYCKDHPDYKNNKAVCAIDNIKRTYTKCMQQDSFL